MEETLSLRLRGKCVGNKKITVDVFKLPFSFLPVVDPHLLVDFFLTGTGTYGLAVSCSALSFARMEMGQLVGFLMLLVYVGMRLAVDWKGSPQKWGEDGRGSLGARCFSSRIHPRIQQ